MRSNNQKTKVAILYSGGRYYGGIEKYLANLFEHIDKDEFELELLSLGEWELTKQLEKMGYNLAIFSGRRISFKSISLIGKYLKNNKFDLLVSQGTVANAYARAVALIYKIPNLVTVHSEQSADYSKSFVRMAYLLIEKLTRFPTARYIAVSQYLKNQLIKSGLPPEKIDVVYNGLNFPKPKARPHKRLVIGSVGRLHPVKGYDLLIAAFSKMDNKRLRLKIAGSGGELENLEKIAKDLGVSERVEFVGFVEDVYKFLDTIDVYVQSSRCEGFGISVVEAMSQGLPVVVTPAGSLKEIVRDGKTGYISNDFSTKSLAEAMSAAVGDYERSKLIAEDAAAFAVENFDIKSCIVETEKNYREAAK